MTGNIIVPAKPAGSSSVKSNNARKTNTKTKTGAPVKKNTVH